MKISMLLLVSVAIVPVQAIFDYDRASAAHQQNNDPASAAILSSLLVDDSENPSLLYDAGVVAYKQHDYTQACAYFQRAALSKDLKSELAERIHFNLGNAQVQLKQLHDALKEYEKVLEINPDNHMARHNRDKVKEMLEQEQNQENNQKNDRQKDNRQQDSRSKNNPSNDSSETNNQNNSSDDNTKNEKKDSGADAKNAQEKSEQQGNEQKKHDDFHDEDSSDQKSSKNDSNSKNRSHDMSNEQKSEQQKQEDRERRERQHERDDQARAGKQDNGGQQAPAGVSTDQQELNTEPNAGLEKLDAGLAQFVQEQAQADADLNKQLIKMMVEQQSKRNQHGPQW